MSYIVNGMVRGRENRAVGSPAGRENIQSGVVPPLQPVPSKFLAATVSTSLTRSNDVATATATAHGLIVGDVVRIAGAAETEFNGDHRVDSVADANTFTYAVYGAVTSPATGTITSQKRMV